MLKGTTMKPQSITKEQALEVKKELVHKLKNISEYLVGIGVSKKSHDNYVVVVRLSEMPPEGKIIPVVYNEVPIEVKVIGKVFFI
jgi:hypothetical protein